MGSNRIETIRRFFSRTANESELKDLFLWLNSTKGQRQLHQSLDESWKQVNTGENVPIDSMKMLTIIRNNIKRERILAFRYIIKKSVPYAAAFLIAFIAGGILFNLLDVNIGTEKYSTAYASVVVENGQRSKLMLPDSSIVWLNSGTTISYNNSFAGSKRDVRLTGQAFFEVVKNEKVPLVVHCGNLSVKVLGTKFDVDAYSGTKKINVVLESGSVQLLNESKKGFSYRLNPGEVAEFDVESNQITKKQADIEKLTSWRNGALIFKNDPMGQVIEKLERWYDIQFEVSDPAVYTSIFTGTIRNENFEQILKLIEYSCPVDFEIESNGNPGSVPQIKVSKKR